MFNSLDYFSISLNKPMQPMIQRWIWNNSWRINPSYDLNFTLCPSSVVTLFGDFYRSKLLEASFSRRSLRTQRLSWARKLNNSAWILVSASGPWTEFSSNIWKGYWDSWPSSAPVRWSGTSRIRSTSLTQFTRKAARTTLPELRPWRVWRRSPEAGLTCSCTNCTGSSCPG